MINKFMYFYLWYNLCAYITTWCYISLLPMPIFALLLEISTDTNPFSMKISNDNKRLSSSQKEKEQITVCKSAKLRFRDLSLV